jgi:hypothetical protein
MNTRSLVTETVTKDAGRSRTPSAGADSTPLSSRDLSGTMSGRLLTASRAWADCAFRAVTRGDVEDARFWATEAAHFYNRALATL